MEEDTVTNKNGQIVIYQTADSQTQIEVWAEKDTLISILWLIFRG